VACWPARAITIWRYLAQKKPRRQPYWGKKSFKRRYSGLGTKERIVFHGTWLDMRPGKRASTSNQRGIRRQEGGKQEIRERPSHDPNMDGRLKEIDTKPKKNRETEESKGGNEGGRRKYVYDVPNVILHLGTTAFSRGGLQSFTKLGNLGISKGGVDSALYACSCLSRRRSGRKSGAPLGGAAGHWEEN